MVLGRKTNFFLGKTKKNKKNIFWETMRPNSKKMFFWFSLGKNGFGQENQLFPRKKMVLDRKTNFFLARKKLVLDRKTNFFLGKRWFWAEKPTFS